MPSKPKRPVPLPSSPPKQQSTANDSKSTTSRSTPPVVNDHDVAASIKSKFNNSNSVRTKGLEDAAVEPAQSVNRKKQKRREKQAARLAAEQQAKDLYPLNNITNQNGTSRSSGGTRDNSTHTVLEPPSSTRTNNHISSVDHEEVAENDDVYYTDDESQTYTQSSTHYHERLGVRKTKKKKGRKHRSGSATNAGEGSVTSLSTPSASVIRAPPPALSSAALRSAHRISKDRIWNTSTQEERENIKEFWLELGEDERRSLVKVEKEAVLRKMKEQQKHSCSCTVCGRKRTAIEEELEVLYDAYYEELEQYANHNQGSFENGAPIVTPPRLCHPPSCSFDRQPHPPNIQNPSQGRVQELPDDEEELDEEYDEDDEDEDSYSEGDLDGLEGNRADFFAFGNSLTVKGVFLYTFR